MNRAFNSSEAIIEAFWDRQLSQVKKWTIGPNLEECRTLEGEMSLDEEITSCKKLPNSVYINDEGYVVEPSCSHGLRVSQIWCNLMFEWRSKPKNGLALLMTRDMNVSCESYTDMMVSLLAPPNTHVVIEAITDRGIRRIIEKVVSDNKREYMLPLDDARVIKHIRLEIRTHASCPAAGHIQWIGLQHKGRLIDYLKQYKEYESQWYPHLMPQGYNPLFEPHYGLLVDKGRIDDMRLRHEYLYNQSGISVMVEQGKQAMGQVPETFINDYVNFWNDTRYCRERDYDKQLLGFQPYGLAVRAAVAGLIQEDASLMRLAARYAMSLAMCTHFDDGFINRFPGSNFETKGFVPELCVYELVMTLDLAWDMFTEVGRQFIMRRISTQGLGNLNYLVWKHSEKPEQIMKMNQFTWFNLGRIMAMLLLEKSWELVKPYTEIAYRETISSIDQCILPDGGYVEGPIYFGILSNYAGLSLYAYAKARELPFESVIPESMKRTSDFAEALMSTDMDYDMIRICDCAQVLMNMESMAIMAILLPESHWTTLFWKAVKRNGGIPNSIISLQMMSEIPEVKLPMRPYIELKDMGIISSFRETYSNSVKWLLQGNKGGAGHTHEDKGSFVLEFMGETFFEDVGSCDYGKSLSKLLRNCDRHNMLVPYGRTRRAHPKCPLPVDVKPSARGNKTMFHAHCDLSKGWEGSYKRWQRSWSSDKPLQMTIKDDYELVEGDGVDFLLQTYKSVERTHEGFDVKGEKGIIHVHVPLGLEWFVESLDMLEGRKINRVSIRCQGPKGIIEIKMELEVKHKAL